MKLIKKKISWIVWIVSFQVSELKLLMAESCFSWQSATWLAQMRRELQPGTASSCCFGTCWAIP